MRPDNICSLHSAANKITVLDWSSDSNRTFIYYLYAIHNILKHLQWIRLSIFTHEFLINAAKYRMAFSDQSRYSEPWATPFKPYSLGTNDFPNDCVKVYFTVMTVCSRRQAHCSSLRYLKLTPSCRIRPHLDLFSLKNWSRINQDLEKLPKWFDH